MPGIYVAALLTSLAAIAGFGALICKLPKPANGWLLLATIMICLPLQPLAFYWVRLPLDHGIAGHLARTSFAYQFVASLYAPLTEEPARLLMPAILRDMRSDNVVRYALTIGLGFALGEMWFIAERVSHQLALAKLPFYQFGGYVSERVMTCQVLPLGWVYGIRPCPECASDFEPSILAVNLGNERYVRCPHCRKWLRTKPSTAKQIAPPNPPG